MAISLHLRPTNRHRRLIQNPKLLNFFSSSYPRDDQTSYSSSSTVTPPQPFKSSTISPNQSPSGFRRLATAPYTPSFSKESALDRHAFDLRRKLKEEKPAFGRNIYDQSALGGYVFDPVQDMEEEEEAEGEGEGEQRALDEDVLKRVREGIANLKISSMNATTDKRRLEYETPNVMLSQPNEKLVEKYVHPENMSSSEKLKMDQLKKCADVFKLSESDCGSAHVQEINPSKNFPEKKDTEARVDFILSLPKKQQTLKVEMEEAKKEEKEKSGKEEEESLIRRRKTTSESRSKMSSEFSMSELQNVVKSAHVKAEGLPPVHPSLKKQLEVIEVKDKSPFKIKDVESIQKKKKIGATNVEEDDGFEDLELDEIGARIVRCVGDKTREIVAQACAVLKSEMNSLEERALVAEKLVKKMEKKKLNNEKKQKGAKTKLTNKIAQLEKALKEKSAEMSRLEENHLQETEKVKEDFKNSAAKVMVQTRIYMIESYAQGLHTSWNLEDERASLRIMCGEDVDADVGEGNAGEVESQMKEALL